MKRTLLFLVFTGLLLLVLPQQVFAQENWQITNFASDIVIKVDGKVHVSEVIDVDFKTLQKHGIFRDIPYTYNSSSGTVYTTVLDITVLQDGAYGQFSTEKSTSYYRLKIGNPSVTISGVHSYTISYDVTGVLKSYTDHDELYWNITGGMWEVPIEKASATVYLTKPGISKIVCFEGIKGSTTPCSNTQVDNQRTTFSSTRELTSQEGLTLVVGYTKGLFPILNVPSKERTIFSYFNPVIFGLALIIGLGCVFSLWWKNGRDLLVKQEDGTRDIPIGANIVGVDPSGPVVVEYTPPDNLRPAEVGILLDERADTLDITATIIDLASRGYLTITEESKTWIFGSTDYIMTKTSKTPDSLLTYEKILYKDIFHLGREVRMSQLKRSFYEQLKTVKSSLYLEGITKKFFSQNPENVRAHYLGIGLVVVILSVIFSVTGFANDIITSIAAACAISGVALMIISPFMPKRTPYGRQLFARIKGYELFVTHAEKYRQKYFEKENLFNEILPYAIVFGVTEKFAHELQDMGVKLENPKWYHSAHPLNLVLFSSSINSFSSSMSSAISSVPQSSISGSSGFSGGSSGGGFGGGGGGSW